MNQKWLNPAKSNSSENYFHEIRLWYYLFIDEGSSWTDRIPVAVKYCLSIQMLWQVISMKIPFVECQSGDRSKSHALEKNHATDTNKWNCRVSTLSLSPTYPNLFEAIWTYPNLIWPYLNLSEPIWIYMNLSEFIWT